MRGMVPTHGTALWFDDRCLNPWYQGGLFRTSEDYFRTRRVAIGDGPLSGRIGFAYSTYRKRTVERVLYHRVLSLRDSRSVRVDRADPVFHSRGGSPRLA